MNALKQIAALVLPVLFVLLAIRVGGEAVGQLLIPLAIIAGLGIAARILLSRPR